MSKFTKLMAGAVLAVAPDASGVPWQAQLVSGSPLTVCRAGS